ncbi:MAG TPA: gamma-glutamylcyclotransferase family protein [Candidatus Binatia bacterium]
MFYFAYGSNMNWSQMRQRCPSARFVAVASLEGHRLAITRKSRRRLCGTADVVAEAGCEVWGIVYEIAAGELSVLDGFEDGYGREKMMVRPGNDGGRPLEAWVYIAEKEDSPPPPNALYKRLILEGARYWRLPDAYVAMLEMIEATED